VVSGARASARAGNGFLPPPPPIFPLPVPESPRECANTGSPFPFRPLSVDPRAVPVVERVAQRPSHPSVRTGTHSRRRDGARIGTGEFFACACLAVAHLLSSYPPAAQPAPLASCKQRGGEGTGTPMMAGCHLRRTNPGLKAWWGGVRRTDTDLRGAPEGPRFTVAPQATCFQCDIGDTGQSHGCHALPRLVLPVKDKRKGPPPPGTGRPETPRDHAGLGTPVCRAQVNWGELVQLDYNKA
jgi:hypothetical protein